MSALQAVESRKPLIAQAFAITLEQCVLAEQALSRIGSQAYAPKLSYHVAKLLKLVREEAKHWHEQRDALVKELGSKRATTLAERQAGMGDEIFTVTPEHTETFQARLKEISAIETAIPWAPLTMTEINALPNVRADDLVMLGPCFNDSEQEAS